MRTMRNRLLAKGVPSMYKLMCKAKKRRSALYLAGMGDAYARRIMGLEKLVKELEHLLFLDV